MLGFMAAKPAQSASLEHHLEESEFIMPPIPALDHTVSKGKTIRPLSPGDFVSTEEITPFTVSEDDIDVLPEIPSLPDNIISESGDDDDESDLPLDGVLDTIAGEDPITTPCASWSMHLIPDQFGVSELFLFTLSCIKTLIYQLLYLPSRL